MLVYIHFDSKQHEVQMAKEAALAIVSGDVVDIYTPQGPIIVKVDVRKIRINDQGDVVSIHLHGYDLS